MGSTSAADGVSHYDLGGIEAIRVIEEFVNAGVDCGSEGDGTRGYLLGNFLKYILRAGKKGPTRGDLVKAYDYWFRYHWEKWPERNPFK